MNVALIALAVLTVLFAALFVVFRRRDARMLRNGVFLTAAIVLGAFTVVGVLVSVSPTLGSLVVVPLALAPVAIVVLGIALIGNGVTMLRSEGRRLGNLLSLVLGVLVFVLPVAAVLLFALGPVGAGIAVALVLVGAYFGCAFVAFAVYSVVYGRIRHRFHPAAIVVLGSGLVDGQVPPLLRSRLNRALEVQRREQAAGRRPLLIPTGGQGADEPRPEGTAMAEYLVAQGADPADVHPEVEARNTRENITLALGVQRAAGRAGPALVVTNDYHVLRTALLARRLGTDAQVTGSPTARYYVPSAFLREFVAVIVEHRWFNAVACVPFVAVAAALAIEAARQQ